MEKPRTLQQAIVFFANPDNCQDYLLKIRYPNGRVRCPYCGSGKVSYLAKQRRWKCYSGHAKPQFSIKVGTVMEDSAIGLDKWLTAIWMIANCKNGVSSYEIQRDLGVTQKTAWFMLHRIREGMDNDFPEKFAGEVEADETFIGGKAKNMHLMKKIRKQLAGEMKGGGPVGKAIVMGVLQRNTTEEIPGTARRRSKQDSQVRPLVLAELRKTDTDAHIKENVALDADGVYTDDGQHYRYLPDYAHEFINHEEAYVRGRVHTNGIENFWSLLKRSLAGTYISVEPFHLTAYVNEQAFRFNNRKDTDVERFDTMLAGIVGKRVTYEELTGKSETD